MPNIKRHIGLYLNLVILSTLLMPTVHAVDELLDMQHFFALEVQNLKKVHKVFALSKKQVYQALISFHAETLQVNYNENYLIMQLEQDQIEQLKSFGFTIEQAEQWQTKRQAQIERSMRNFAAKQTLGDTESAQGKNTIPLFSCYDTVETTLEKIQNIANNHPQISELIDIGDSWRKANDLGGFDLIVLKLTRKNTIPNKPKMFIQSAMHAREYATAPLILDFAEHLAEQYEQNADITWILDHHEIHLLLHANPDGRKQAEAGILWRKNANTNYCPNGNLGADLNRNYSFFWSFDEQGSSNDACRETYRGINPASEPETAAVEAYIRQLFPDNRGPTNDDAAPTNTSGMHLDIHSFGELILWPWGHTNEPSANEAQLQTLGRKLAFPMNYFPSRAIGLAPTNGTSDEVSYGELGVAAFTYELGTEFFQSCENYENTIKQPNLDSLLYAAKVLRTPYQTAYGPDLEAITINNMSNTISVEAGSTITVNALAKDDRYSTLNGIEPTQAIASVAVYVDQVPWAPDNQATAALTTIDDAFDQTTERVTISLNTSNWSPGRHTLFLQAQDTDQNKGAVSAVFVDIISTLENLTPLARFTTVCEANTFSFNAEQSADLDGDIISYNWNLGDGTRISGPQVSHTYNNAGDYTVVLTVTDNTDISNEAEQTIKVGENGKAICNESINFLGILHPIFIVIFILPILYPHRFNTKGYKLEQSEFRSDKC